MAWKVTIAGVDKTSSLKSATLDRTANERATASLVCKQNYYPARGGEVVLYDFDGTTPLFGGVITSRGASAAGTGTGVTASCADWWLYLDQVVLNLTYTTAPTLEDVLDDIVATSEATAFGFTVHPSQVTGPTLDAFTWTNKRASDALRDLSTQTGYVIRVDATKRIRAVRPGGNLLENPRFVDGTLNDAGGNAAGWSSDGGTATGTWAKGVNLVDEKVTDGGLEAWASATNLTNWTEGISGSSSVNRESADVHAGTYCARLDIDAGNAIAYAYQSLTLVAGAPYRLSFWYKTTNGKPACAVLRNSTSNVFLAADGTWSGSLQTLPAASAWTFVSIEFTAHASYTAYTLYFGAGTGVTSSASSSFYVDAFSLVGENYLANEGSGYIRETTGASSTGYRYVKGPVFATVEGTSYTFCAYLNVHRCQYGYVSIRFLGETLWHDSNIVYPLSTLLRGDTLDEYQFVTVTATAPVGGTTCELLIGNNCNGTGAGPALFFSHLWFGETADRVTWDINDTSDALVCDWSDADDLPFTRVSVSCGPSSLFSYTKRWTANGTDKTFTADLTPADGAEGWPGVAYLDEGLPGHQERALYDSTAIWSSIATALVWDASTKELKWNPAGSAPAAGTTIRLTYGTVGPFTVTADSGRTPISTYTESRPDLIDYDAALSYAEGRLNLVGATYKTVNITTRDAGLDVNRTQRANSSRRALYEDVILTSVSVSLGEGETTGMWSASGTTAEYVGDSPLSEFRATSTSTTSSTTTAAAGDIGIIVAFARSSPPTNFEACDGGLLSRTDYADLFAVIGTTFGAGDGSTTFAKPDLRGKYIMGVATSGTGATFGDTFGVIDHTHTVAAHTHSVSCTAASGGAHTHTLSGSTANTSNNHSHTFSTSSDGSHQHTIPDADNIQSGAGGTAASTTTNADGTHSHSGTTNGQDTDHNHAVGSLATASDGAHTHTVSGTAASDGSGNTGTGNPPTVALLWCIKVH